jgi:hypothetical protein
VRGDPSDAMSLASCFPQPLGGTVATVMDLLWPLTRNCVPSDFGEELENPSILGQVAGLATGTFEWLLGEFFLGGCGWGWGWGWGWYFSIVLLTIIAI